MMTEFTKRIEYLDKVFQSKGPNLKSGNWEVFSKRFVAFFDIAGFKKTSSYKFYSYRLLQVMKEIAQEERKAFREKTGIDINEYVFVVAISDSLIVFSKDDSINSFCCFSHAIGRIFNICVVSLGRFMNAAVAYGEITVDKEALIFAGEPYNQAYGLQEQMDYYGILCDASLDEYLVMHKDSTDENYLRYSSHYVATECYTKPNDNEDHHTEKLFNYFWIDQGLYGEVLYSNDYLENRTDEFGIVCGTYLQHVCYWIENYGEDNDKIKKRLNNTMDVLESMQKPQRINYNLTFTRYKLNLDQ